MAQQQRLQQRTGGAPAALGDDDALGFFLKRLRTSPAPGDSSNSSNRSNSNQTAAGAARRRKHQEDDDEQGAAVQTTKPIAVAAVSAVSGYYCVKSILKGYQQLRRRNLRHLIRTVGPALDAMHATWWLDFGSLLGAHRDKDVIIHDNDADIVVLNPDWDALLAALRTALPQFRVFFVAPSEDRSIRWIRVLHGIGVMDLYGGYDTTHGATPGVISIPQGHGDLCDIPSQLVFPLGSMKFKGVGVSTPGDVHGALRYRYGSDYMVPKYMDKGRDHVEQGKFYAKLLGVLGRAGLRI